METQKTQNLRPKVGSALSYGWSILWDKFITLFLILLIVWVVSIPMGVMEASGNHGFITTVFGTFSFLYYLFLYMPIRISANFMYVRAIRNEKLDVKNILDVFDYYLNVVLANLLKVAIVGIGLAFLLVPGIIFACRLAFVNYLVLDKKMDPVKAVEESWRLTRGHGWRILWMGIVSFFLFFAGLAAMVFGAVIAVMWIKAGFAAYYQAVLEQNGEYEFEKQVEENLNEEQPAEERVEEPEVVVEEVAETETLEETQETKAESEDKDDEKNTDKNPE